MTAPYTSRPEFGFYLAFNADPNDGATTPNWVEFTQYVKSMSSLSRGVNYELDTALAAEPSVLLRDVDEYLNSANPSSPYYPNVVPWRRVLFMGTYPQAAGNLLNAGAWHGNNEAPVDPTFDSYAAGGTLPWWIGRTNSATVTIDTTTPRSGINCVLATWTATSGGQGMNYRVRTMPGRQYTASAYVRLASANTALISVIGGVSGTSTTTVGAYVRLSVTFTATQPLTFMAVATTGTTAAGSLRVDDVQLERGTSVSAFTTAGPVVYPIMAPYAERFQKVYEDGGFTGYAQIPCVDALAALSNTTIGTDFYNAVSVQYPPDHWWPMAGGTLTSAYLPGPSAKATPPLTTLISKNGLGNGSAPAPGSPTNILGDAGGTGVVFVPPSPAVVITTAGQGAILATSQPLAFPAVTGTAGYSATIAAWVVLTTLTALENPGLVTPVAGSATTSLPPSLNIATTSGQGFASVGGNGDLSGTPLTAIGGPVLNDGKPHFLALTVVQDVTNTVLRLYVDGTNVSATTATTSSIGGVLTAATTGRSVQMGGQFGYGQYQHHLTGLLAQAMVWDSALAAGTIFDLWHAGLGYNGLITSGNRVAQHVLTYGRYAGLTRISEPGATLMEAPSYVGSIDELTDTNNTVDAELGRTWAAPDGAFVFESRTDRYLRLTPLYVLGQNVAGGMLPYEEDVEFDTDPQYIYVRVQYTRAGGATGTGGSPADVAAAGLRYFYPEFTKTVDVYADQQAQDLADWVFHTHNGAVQRVAQIRFNPAANPSLWAFCLSIECGQRVTVSMGAPAANGGAGLTWSADFFVENVTHDNIDADTGAWDTILWMSPLALGTPQSAQPWVLENAVYGQLDITTKLAP